MLQILWEHLQSIHSALKFVPDFIHLYSRGDKKNKYSKPLTKINSTESFTADLVLKFLPETIHELDILQKIFQDLTHYDKLIIQLT